ncbi:alpha/beta hydrolase [uncultured Desulfosarcina sp.]|uniref:alpha/beta hydrolase n=1 Tax=uncultured Desulfosarcina sp. TaxID=218289 RepID=UPI0029C87C16|nr:alpha/beta hydrolase [uncultured Desulfosarcina sp.]
MPKAAEQPVTIKVQGLKLSGVLHLPPGNPSAVIVGCHGLMADKSSPKQVALAGRCTDAGMAYFRFDHRGCGESEGSFEKDTTLENRVMDLMAVVRTIRGILGKNLPVGLFGSSLGGTVCLMASSEIAPFAVVTLAAPVRSRSIRLPENSPESLTKETLEGKIRFDIVTSLESIDHLLVIHGSNDETVPVENASWIYSQANDPKALLILKNADHRISDEINQQRFMENAVQWFSDCYGSRSGGQA